MENRLFSACFWNYSDGVVFLVINFLTLYLGEWSWSCGSWIYNYLCNQCLSPLTLWIRTQLMARCTRYKIMTFC